MTSVGNILTAHLEGQFIPLQPGADRLLVDLARRAERDGVDEHYIVGHPPFGDLAIQIAANIVGARLRARLELAEQDRPFVPFGMRDADDRGDGNRGMAGRDILYLDRADPFAARFDDILRAVGNLHIAFAVDRADVAGIEKAFIVEHIAALATEIAARDRRPLDHQPPRRLAIVRQPVAGAVSYTHLDVYKRQIESRLSKSDGIFLLLS